MRLVIIPGILIISLMVYSVFFSQVPLGTPAQAHGKLTNSTYQKTLIDK